MRPCSKAGLQQNKNLKCSTPHRPVSLFDAILPHDIQDAMPDGIPIPSTSGEASCRQSRKIAAPGVAAGPRLQHRAAPC